MPFQHGIDRARVNAGVSTADLRHPKLLQPVPQRFQIARHRPKGPHLLPRPLARGADQDAGNDRLLVNVKPGASLNDHLHLRLHSKEGDRDAAGIVETLPRVLPVPGGDKKWYLYAARAGLSIGVASHRSRFQPQHDRPWRASDKPARAATIFTHNGAPKALVGCPGTSERSLRSLGPPPAGCAPRPAGPRASHWATPAGNPRSLQTGSCRRFRPT